MNVIDTCKAEQIIRMHSRERRWLPPTTLQLRLARLREARDLRPSAG